MSDYEATIEHAKEVVVRAVSESPAFPTLELSHPLEEPHPGMTLRQWLMGTIAAGMARQFRWWKDEQKPVWDAVQLATVAGSMADAIIREDVMRTLEESAE